MKRFKSKLDKQKKKKKELAEDLEYLRNVDVPESQGGGRKYVTDKIKEDEKIDEGKRFDLATSLQSHKATYLTRLATYGQSALESIDWPEGWERYCVGTDGRDIRVYGKWYKTKIGIQMIVKDPKGNVYMRGVLVTYDPIIDIKNVDTLSIQAENTLDSYKGLLLSDNQDTVSTLKRTKGGIYFVN